MPGLESVTISCMRLSLLGGLKVEGSSLTRPKPLLLLAYLSLNGSRDRRDLAELFFIGTQDPAQGLRVALSHLNKEASGVLRTSEKRLWTEVPSDVAELEAALAQGDYQKVLELYRGPFLEGFDLSDLGEELEEWLYRVRERVAGQVREAKLSLAEQLARRGDYATAAKEAEETMHLRFAPELEPDRLERIYTLLRAGELATETILKEAKDYGLELSLSVDEARSKLQTLAPQKSLLAPNPYQGLFAFQEKDAAFFFGREGAARDIVQRCQASPYIVTVIGNSGAGKSSLVFAGVVPLLRKANWLICSLRPGRQPFEALASALTELLEPSSEHILESQRLAGELKENTLELSTLILGLLSKQPQQRLLIVVDQLEELFTITEGMHETASFLEVLLQGVQRSQGQLSLIVTLRADFIGALLTHPAILAMLQETRYFLGPMTEDELRKAIAEPARQHNVTFEAGLVNRIVADVSGQEGSLPLLEFALTQLWDEQKNGTLTHQAYDAIGGVEEALANHADATFATLSQPEQQLARKVFLQLVYPGVGQEDTRRIATREELGNAWPLVQTLASYPARLLVTGYSETGEQTAEVSHEALIRRWGKLRSWLSDYRSFRTWQERLRQDVRLWREENQAEATLLRGYRLEEARGRSQNDSELLSESEREFIGQSLMVRDLELKLQEQERQEKLASLTRLAEEETSRRKAEQARVKFRTRALWLLSLLGCLAIGLALFSYTARNQAVTARNEATALLPKLLSSVAINTQEASPQRSLLLALEADRIATEHRLQNTAEVQRVLRQLVSETGGMTLPHSERVVVTRFSPDGKYLATLSDDGVLRLWEMDSPAREAMLTLETGARSVKFSPDSRWLLSSDETGLIRFWDLNAHSKEPTLSLQTAGSMIKTSADGAWLITGNSEALQVWNLHSLPQAPRLQTTLSLADDAVVAFDFSRDSRYFFTVSASNDIKIWEAETWQLLRQLNDSSNIEFSVWTLVLSEDGQWLALPLETQVLLWDLTTSKQTTLRLEATITALNFSPNSQWFAVGENNGQTYVWKTSDLKGEATLAEPRRLLGHSEAVFEVAFSPDGRYLATASKDKTAQLWLLEKLASPETFKRALPIRLKGHEGGVVTLAFHPSSQRLVTGSEDNSARLWNLNIPGPDITVLNAQGEAQRRTDISPDGTLLASGHVDGTVYLQSMQAAPRSSMILGKHDSWVESLAFNPKGDYLVTASDASGGGENVLELWNLTAQPIRAVRFPLTKESQTIFDVTFSHDGNFLATAGEDKTAQLWDIKDLSKPQTIFSGHEDIVTEVAFSPDDKLLATASFDSFIRIWDVNNPDNPIKTLEGHSKGVRTLAFSPDGTLLASAGQDSRVKIWSTKTLEVVTTLFAGSRVWAVAFSPDSKMLATANEDGTLGLWHVSTSTLEPLEGHTSTAWSVTFSRDGQWLVSASEDGTVRFWPVPVETVRGQACYKAGRNLTQEEWQEMFGTMPYHATCPEVLEND
jgi:WD40 repeat protein